MSNSKKVEELRNEILHFEEKLRATKSLSMQGAYLGILVALSEELQEMEKES